MHVYAYGHVHVCADTQFVCRCMYRKTNTRMCPALKKKHPDRTQVLNLSGGRQTKVSNGAQSSWSSWKSSQANLNADSKQTAISFLAWIDGSRFSFQWVNSCNEHTLCCPCRRQAWKRIPLSFNYFQIAMDSNGLTCTARHG